MNSYRVVITDLGFNGWCSLENLKEMLETEVYTDLEGIHGDRRKVTINGEVVDRDALQALIDTAEPSITEHGQARLYPPIGEQMDMIFKEVKANGTISANGEWATTVQAIKDSVTAETVAEWPPIEEIVVADPNDTPEPIYISEKELAANPL